MSISADLMGNAAAPRLEGEIDYIDHVCPVVDDIDRAAAVYTRLGFLLSPLSMHQGAITPGGTPRPLGSGNRCAIFRHSYVEVLAHIREDLPDLLGIGGFLRRFEGLHILCYGCSNADQLERRVRERGVANSAVIPLQRDVQTDDGLLTARFRRIVFDPGATPEGLVHAAEHLTPGLIHQPLYENHPNGALDITDVIVAVPDSDVRVFERRYASYLGRAARADGPVRVFELPLGRTSIVPASALGPLLPGEAPPALPSIVAYTVAVKDLNVARALLAANGLPVVAVGQRFFVPGREALGGAVIFEQAAA